MVKQEVKRIMLTGVETEIKFPKGSSRYIVKNYGSGDIYVSFSPKVEESTSIKIAKGMGQVCFGMLSGGATGMGGESCSDKIYIKGSGEVEVQQVWN